MWVEILGGATVFGAIMAIAAFINGRSTKRFVAKLIKEMSNKMEEGFKLIARLIVEENDKTRQELLEALKK